MTTIKFEIIQEIELIESQLEYYESSDYDSTSQPVVHAKDRLAVLYQQWKDWKNNDE